MTHANRAKRGKTHASSYFCFCVVRDWLRQRSACYDWKDPFGWVFFLTNESGEKFYRSKGKVLHFNDALLVHRTQEGLKIFCVLLVTYLDRKAGSFTRKGHGQSYFESL